MLEIYTIGHSNIPIQKLVDELMTAQIRNVVDVRTKPYSRYSPQYNREALAESLKRNKIQYFYRGKNLGGLGKNYDFKGAISEVAGLALKDKTALLCAEKKYQECHRSTMLAPEFISLGFKVIHLQNEIREVSRDVNSSILDL